MHRVSEGSLKRHSNDLYPYARKSDTWVQKKDQKKQKTVFLFKKLNQEVAGLINKQCLGGYFDLSFKTKREFFLKKVLKNYKC